ncbi:hypothetical protein ACOSQ3_014441 [Xanthoceras sorbifolium]
MGAGDIAQAEFRFVDFWVQIHPIPLLCITRDIAMFLGFSIGKVKEVDRGASGDYLGRYLRVRVAVDVTQPLKRCLKVDVDGSGPVTKMPLRYERLPNFCTLCGHIGHLFRECSISEPMKGDAAPAEYGP